MDAHAAALLAFGAETADHARAVLPFSGSDHKRPQVGPAAPHHAGPLCTGRLYIGAGWGQRTQWYQNILADPRVTVETRGPAFGAVARSVTDEELRAIYRHARGMGPLWMWKRSLESWDIRDEIADFVAKRDRIPFLRLDPAGECPLPPLRADLVWVWPVLAIAVAGAYVLLRT